MNRNLSPWHTLSRDKSLEHLDTHPTDGLSHDEARVRLKQIGENKLAEQPPRPLWLKFLDQFKSFLIIVLLFAAVLAYTVGDLKDAIVILAVVLFNALLGFYQEHRAERTLDALKGMLAPKAKVRRDGQLHEIDARNLVPGDVVVLEAGNRVPADGRVLDAHASEVDESTLTGESYPVSKSTEPLECHDLPLGDRVNMLYMNTVMTRGRVQMLVTETGMQTEMGKLAGMIAQTQERSSPLQRQLDTLGKRLAAIAGVAVVLILALDFLRGVPWVEAAMTAVALAVAAIPEGLPAVVTVTLAIGMRRMAQNRAILKKLSAVETLGSTTVICSDKTGTLTINQMTVRAGWFAGGQFSVSGEGYEPQGEIDRAGAANFQALARPVALCSEATVREGKLVGDPTEGALLVLAQKFGIDPETERRASPRLAEIPFDSAHKFMATFHQGGDDIQMLIKGAPDVLLERCLYWLSEDGPAPLDDDMRAALQAENDRLAEQALRVIAVATRSISTNDFDAKQDQWHWAENWVLVGLVGLMDPPRSEARKAIELCRRAGVQVKMITGDHKVTAMAIARELGLKGDAVAGKDLDVMSDEELAQRIDDIVVFARVAPQHKVRIVQALKTKGHIVAMTGDGVNDAPALKAADIGMAMGITGTEVTKQAATLVLTDDNFATIVRAVKEGRTIYDNIIKFVRFQLSTNIGAIFTVLTATLLALPTPFTPIQLLWINIIMDGPPAMTLGIEPPRPGLMRDPPRRPDSQILTWPRLTRLILYGATMMVGTLSVFWYALQTANQAYALTLAFTTFVLFQVFNVFNARAEFHSAFNRNFLKNTKLWLALLSVVLLQIMAVHWTPAQAIFNTVDLRATDWGLAALIASSVLFLDEGRKLALRLLQRS